MKKRRYKSLRNFNEYEFSALDYAIAFFYIGVLGVLAAIVYFLFTRFTN